MAPVGRPRRRCLLRRLLPHIPVQFRGFVCINKCQSRWQTKHWPTSPRYHTDEGTGQSMHNILALPHESDTVSDEVAQVHAARGDPAAFAALYHRYRDRVYWYVRTRTTTEEDAADLTQHVFVQALDALGQYRPHRGSFAAW